MSEVIGLANGKKIVVGINDLATTHPYLVKEWNDNLSPTHFSRGSRKIVKWKCSDCGNTWNKEIRERAKGSGCGVCSGNIVKKGINDLATTHPELAKEWDDSISPTEVRKSSDKNVQWKCKNGHSWVARIRNRAKGSNCRLCTTVTVQGVNDLATTHPFLVRQWNEECIFPEDYNTTSKKVVNWKCDKGHEWKEGIYFRSREEECPVCSGSRVVKGVNDLVTTHPDLAKEWDKSNASFPDTASFTDFKSVIWKCGQCNEQWKATIRDRVNGAKCPTCLDIEIDKKLAGTELTVKGVQNLESKWDYSKNLENPAQVFTDSNSKYWWNCDRGHSFLRSVKKEHENHSCPICSNIEVLAGFNDLTTTHQDLVKEWNDELSPTGFTYGSNQLVEWRCSKGHEWTARISDRTQGVSCPACFKGGVSEKELEFQEFVKNLLPAEKLLFNDRSLIPPKELDVYLPDKNLAFEFNGVYWHSEAQGKGKDYHYNKWKECKDKGVQLIQVWEDDWDNKRNLIEEMIKNKLGVSTLDKIPARKTKIKPLEVSEARKFLDQYHIQGFVGARYHYALVFDEEPAAVLSLRSRGENKYELVRYATSAIVQGGFSKLLKHAVEELTPSKIITFSDNEVSDGGLYESTGFEREGELAPDYSYLVGGKREHKFGYRKKKFKDDPDLLWKPGLTEGELAKLNELERVWDSGKVRWVLESLGRL